MRASFPAMCITLLLAAPAAGGPPVGAWGAAPSDVEAASGGTLPRTTGAERQRLGALMLGNAGQQEVAGVPVLSKYYYLIDRLAMVVLVPLRSEGCHALRAHLEQAQGPAGEAVDLQPVGRRYRWRDRAGDEVTLFDYGQSCTLDLRPAPR